MSTGIDKILWSIQIALINKVSPKLFGNFKLLGNADQGQNLGSKIKSANFV